jgi:RHS repeat-associated protein
VIESVAYTYDANGQRLSRSVGTGTPRDTLFAASYDNANRMSAITLNPGTAQTKTFNLTYDDQGNLIRKENAADASEHTLYIWDARNRLATIALQEGGNTSTAAFRYDALGRRIERIVNQSTTVQRTQFVYDGIQAIGELVDGRLSATVLTGLNIDEVIARTVNLAGGSSVDTKTYVTDALGSVLAMTNPSQNPELFYAYSAYGETNQLGVDLGSPPNSNQYTARENDGLVGGTNGGQIHYYRARYYDPLLKRFVSEDPIGLRGGANLYGYVGGDPVVNRDPLGLYSSDVHFNATYRAARDSGMSFFESIALAWNVVMADVGTQGIPDAYKHSMTPDGDDPDQARLDRDAYVAAQMCLGPKGLGNAIHAVQDESARGHRFKNYDGTVTSQHVYHDMYPTQRQWDRIYKDTINLIKQKQTQRCDCPLGK